MKLKDIEKHNIKIGKTSITVKDIYDKTQGIITNVIRYNDAMPRIQMDFYKIVRQFDRIKRENLIIYDGELYYLNNLKPIEFYEKYIADAKDTPIYESETKRYNELKELPHKIKEHMTVIDCYIY